MTKKPFVSIVTLTHNEWPYTQLCLANIRKHTHVPHEVIVVDNGSTDGTVARLRDSEPRSPWLRVVENKANRGFPAGMNRGMERARGDYIVLLNNDTVPSFRWLDNPLHLFQEKRRAGIVGPVSNRVIRQQKVKTHCRSVADIHRYSRLYNRLNPAKWKKTKLLSGFCMIFPRQLMEDIGELDERFGAGTYEDDDYCLRAQMAGYTCWIAGDTYVHHFGNQSFKRRGRREFRKILRQNRQYYMYKWGRKPVNG